MKRFLPALVVLVVTASSCTYVTFINPACELDQPVNATGQVCGGSVQFSPFALADHFVDAGARFQSDAGNGPSRPITITFSHPVASVEVTVYDPNFDGNQMVAKDGAGHEVGRATFPGNHLPQNLTTQTRRLDGTISSVLLVSAPLDYVAYSMVVRIR